MRPASLLILLGFIILMAATFCPMLRPFHLFNWNVYQLNQPYGIVILLVGVIGISGVMLNQLKVTRAAAYASLVLAALLYLAVVLKVHTTFSFIPFNSITGYLTRQINFKWGWLPLFAGPVLAIVGLVFNGKTKYGGLK